MNLSLILSAEAADWYGERSAGLGDRFVDAVRDTFHRIRAAPELHGIVWRDVRCTLVSGFPYAIYYQVKPEGVVVFAVIHTKRDSQVWQSRV
jgi:plasmid stabilization system protein ParE